jgi:hypothetical protein
LGSSRGRGSRIKQAGSEPPHRPRRPCGVCASKAETLRRSRRVSQWCSFRMAHPENRTEDAALSSSTPEGVSWWRGTEGIIIHAAGVRGGFPSSAPEARVAEQ